MTYRSKRFPTIIDKLLREPGRLSDMADIGGVRATVETQDDVDLVREGLIVDLEVRRVRDWARSPRQSGYRALHLHVQQDARTIEVQIRTVGQDTWANMIEEESRLSGTNYKAGHGQEQVLRFYALLADLNAAVELGESHPHLTDELLAAHRAAKPFLRLPGFARL